MHDQLESARLYAENRPHRPFPIIVTVRPIYEAMLYLLFLLRPDRVEERQARGLMFSKFEAWEAKEGIDKGPGGRRAYEKQLAEEERPHHKRRLKIAEEAEAQFTPKQKRQLERGRWNVTWTGRSIASLAKEFEEEIGNGFQVHPWYGVMSMATHVSPGMIHWSYKLTENNKQRDDHDLRCRKCSVDWVGRASRMVFYCSLRFGESYGRDEPDEGRALRQEFETLRGSSEDQNQNEEALRDDPIIRDLVDRIVQAVHPQRIILFGSAVRRQWGEWREDSDFDVLVIVRNGTAVGRAEADMYRSMWGFPLPTDLIAVTEEDARKHASNPNLVVHAALSEGKELYRAAG